MYHLTSGFSTHFMPLGICQKESTVPALCGQRKTVSQKALGWSWKTGKPNLNVSVPPNNCSIWCKFLYCTTLLGTFNEFLSHFTELGKYIHEYIMKKDEHHSMSNTCEELKYYFDTRFIYPSMTSVETSEHGRQRSWSPLPLTLCVAQLWII
jgi:hypothetical protein